MSEVQVVDHLIFKKDEVEYYRLYGNWVCQVCKGSWASAWTYIRLEKYKDQIPAKQLVPEIDYYIQECKKCSKKSSPGRLKKYKHLKQSGQRKKGPQPHITSLCKKCQMGYICGYHDIVLK